MQIPFVDLKAQYKNIMPELKEAVSDVIESCDFVYSDKANKVFEDKVEDFLGITNAIGCSSGTAALHLALESLGIGPGDEVIVPANSFIASALAVSYTGAVPVFVDVDASGSISIDDVLNHLTRRTKAIIAVHLFGHPVNIKALRSKIPSNVTIVEDAAQAFGASYEGKFVGTEGDLACFSFYPAKNLGTCGQGGMVVTDRDDLAVKIKSLLNVGRGEDHFSFKYKGYNYRLNAVNAAFLNVCVDHVMGWNSKRRDIVASWYLSGLDGVCDVIQPHVGAISSYHLLVVKLDTPEIRDSMARFLYRQGIATGIHYPVPIHKTEAYKECNDIVIPNVEYLAERILSLPMFPTMTRDKVGYICDKIKERLADA